jgi:hypothetical protein
MQIDREELSRDLATGMTFLHGTTARFETFDLDMAQAGGPWGRGFYMSNDWELASDYSEGGDVVQATVTMQKPYVIDMDVSYEHSMDVKRVFRGKSATAREHLMALGYDGILLIEGGYVEIVAFTPEQITDLTYVPVAALKPPSSPSP